MSVSDDFNRANGSVGSNYTGTFGGIHSITSNQVVGDSTPERASIRTAESFNTAQSSQVTLTSTTASRGAAVLVRASDGGSGFTGYLGFAGFTNSWSVAEYLNGTQVGADLASGTVSTDFTSGQGIKLTIDASGNMTFERTLSAAEVLTSSVSDNTNATGKPGFYTYQDQSIDDFLATGESGASNVLDDSGSFPNRNLNLVIYG